MIALTSNGTCNIKRCKAGSQPALQRLMLGLVKNSLHYGEAARVSSPRVSKGCLGNALIGLKVRTLDAALANARATDTAYRSAHQGESPQHRARFKHAPNYLCLWLGLWFALGLGWPVNAQPADALSPAEAAAHYRRMMQHLTQKNYSEAIEQGRTLITQSRHYPQTLARMVQAARAAGRLDWAQTAFVPLLEVPALRAYGFYGLGLVNMEKRDFKAAITAFEECLQLAPDFTPAQIEWVNAFVKDQRLEEATRLLTAKVNEPGANANTHLGLGYCYLRAENTSEALREIEIARTLSLTLPEACYYRSLALTRAGRRPESVASLQACWPQVVRDANEEHEQLYLNLLVENYIQLTRFFEAMRILEVALKLARDLYDEGFEEACLIFQALVQERLGNYLQALGQYKQAHQVTLRSSSANSQLNLRNYQRLVGRVYMSLGDYEMARQYFERGLAMSQGAQEKEGAARFLALLGDVHKAQGEIKTAIRYYEEAATYAAQFSNIVQRSYQFELLPYLYTLVGDFAKAEQTIQLGLPQVRQLSLYEQEMNLLNQAGNLSLRMKQPARAAERHRELLEKALERQSPQYAWLAAAGLAEAYEQQRNYEEAIQYYRTSIDIMEKVRDRMAGSDETAGFFQDKVAIYKKLIGLFQQASVSGSALDRDTNAFNYAERARARSFLDLLADAPASSTENVDLKFQQRGRDIAAQVAMLQTRLLQARASAARESHNLIASLSTELAQADQEYQQWKREARLHNQEKTGLKQIEPIHLQGLQGKLSTETVLLEYLLDEKASWLFAVTRAGYEVHRLPGAAQLQQKVAAVREALRGPEVGKLPVYRLQAAALYRDLIAPASGLLKGKKHLVIVADDVLQRLPFEALLSSPATAGPLKDLPYLVRGYSISYAPSASVWALLNERQPQGNAAQQLLTFGDPDYGNQATTEQSALAIATRSALGESLPGKFMRLPHSRREVESIARLFPAASVKVLTGPAANEANAKRGVNLGDYRMLHFAVHGLLNESKPQFSGLVLSLPPELKSAALPDIPPDIPEDGLLQSYEIYNLKLNADLVVLSACETGLGKLVNGEGMIGLTRAFFYAGTPTVVASLWKVADDSTATLMEHFYRHLRDGKVSKAEALRQAQLALIRANKSPYFWAAFVLQGKA